MASPLWLHHCGGPNVALYSLDTIIEIIFLNNFICKIREKLYTDYLKFWRVIWLSIFTNTDLPMMPCTPIARIHPPYLCTIDHSNLYSDQFCPPKNYSSLFRAEKGVCSFFHHRNRRFSGRTPSKNGCGSVLRVTGLHVSMLEYSPNWCANSTTYNNMRDMFIYCKLIIYYKVKCRVLIRLIIDLWRTQDVWRAREPHRNSCSWSSLTHSQFCTSAKSNYIACKSSALIALL